MSFTERLPVAVLAESDEETRLLIRSLLELLGFVVVDAVNEHAVFEAAMCYQPDLILLELKRPVLDGFNAVRRIKKSTELNEIPIISIASPQAATSKTVALAAGCSAHITKPVEFDHLESVVGNLVRCERLSTVSLMIH
jgi:two-component system, cell cycle response regulator DivK